jgi:hypothetical protein
MTTISEIKDAIRALSEKDFDEFSSWFGQFEEKRWDRQIERDQKASPLRDLIGKVRLDETDRRSQEIEEGKVRCQPAHDVVKRARKNLGR